MRWLLHFSKIAVNSAVRAAGIMGSMFFSDTINSESYTGKILEHRKWLTATVTSCNSSRLRCLDDDR